ncbi:hypothetical protein, partial [Hymenobacter crusticola]
MPPRLERHGYAEDGYEFTEDPETPDRPYDAYTNILGYLRGRQHQLPHLEPSAEALYQTAADTAGCLPFRS